MARSRIPASTCENRTLVHSPTMAPPAGDDDKGIALFVRIKYEKYACATFKWTCCMWLKCRSCTKAANTELFQKTFDLETKFIPFIDTTRHLYLTTKPKLHGEIPSWLLNIVDSLTFHQGGDWMREEFNTQMEDLRSRIGREDTSPVPTKPIKYPLFEFLGISAKFEKQGDTFPLVVVSEERTRPAQAKFFRDKLLEMQFLTP